jgi:hypothetical protein
MSTNPPVPQFANVAVSKDKTSATVTLGQTNYHLDARVLSDLITTLMIARRHLAAYSARTSRECDIVRPPRHLGHRDGRG